MLKSIRLYNKKIKIFSMIGAMVIPSLALAETPYQEAERMQRKLEEQRLEDEDRQLTLEKQKPSPEKYLENIEAQIQDHEKKIIHLQIQINQIENEISKAK